MLITINLGNGMNQCCKSINKKTDYIARYTYVSFPFIIVRNQESCSCVQRPDRWGFTTQYLLCECHFRLLFFLLARKGSKSTFVIGKRVRQREKTADLRTCGFLCSHGLNLKLGYGNGEPKQVYPSQKPAGPRPRAIWIEQGTKN